MKLTISICAAIWLSCAAGPAAAQMAGMHHAGNGACAGEALACASSATPIFAPDSSLYLAWATADHVAVAHSTDGGKSFGPVAKVNPDAAKIDPGPDSRLGIAIGRDGQLFISYTILTGADYVGRVYVGRSTDGGRSFTPPEPITNDTASQRFTRLIADTSGKIFAAWIDKREVVPAKQAGRDYTGAALAFAWWDPARKAFTPTRIAQSDSCECCRAAAALDRSGHPVVAFRNIFDTHVRDHAIMTFGANGEPGPLRRVSIDDWQTDVCPHQGPDIAVGPDGAYHVAWFTQGSKRQGLFYARSTDAGISFSAPIRLGDPERTPSRARVLATKNAVWLAWKEFDGTVSSIRAMSSADGGKHWSPARTLAETRNASDQPILIAGGDRAYLSWLTHDEGYHLLALDTQP
ncbi:MAG: glycosyl hydrolase [Rhodospirillales bacterium]|nr:glycosyl hydrolase [Rhodospirillales bacterium]